MKRIIVLGSFAIVGALAIASLASGKPAQRTAGGVKYSATLSAAQIVPPLHGTKAGASGHFSAMLTGTVLKWTLTYTNLTGPGTAAHIHLGARGKTGAALVALCGPCKSPMTGVSNSVTDDEAALMGDGGVYVNVHTAKNPEGEVRGPGQPRSLALRALVGRRVPRGRGGAA